MMGRSHPFFEHVGMKVFLPPPDAKTERMKAAFESAGLSRAISEDTYSAHAAMNALPRDLQCFIDDEMRRFCEKFTNRRGMNHSSERTEFVLSKLTNRPAYYLWTNPQYQ